MPEDQAPDPITRQLWSEEVRLRRRILLLTLIPVAVAALLIWVTGRQVANAGAAVRLAEDSLNTIREELDAAEQEHLQKKLEIDTLETVIALYYAQLEKVGAELARRTRDRAIDSVQARRSIPRIYIHIVSEPQRAAARRLCAALENAGFVCPGVELIPKGQNTSDLRFYSTDDEHAVRDILAVASRMGAQLEVNNLSGRFSAPRGTFEIWLGHDFGR